MSQTSLNIDDELPATGDFILQLYQQIGRLEPEAYKSWALDGLMSLLPFDSAFWAEGAEFGAVIFDAHIHHSVYPAAEWLADYAQFKEADPLALAVFENKGKTVCDVDLMPREAWLRDPVYGPFCRKHQITYTLCTMDYNPTSTLVEVISIYRADEAQPYSAEEKQRMQFLFPHLLETRRRNLQASGRESGCETFSNLDAVAICDPHGVLQHAGETFTQMLLEEFPQWRGSSLPTELVSGLGQKGVAFNGRNIIFPEQSRDGFHLIGARRHSVVETLTPAEQRVALLLLDGHSYREGAGQLGISASTFNKHANKLYRKLDVDGRDTLTQRFATLL